MGVFPSHDKPEEITDSEDGDFDVKYPTRIGVRASDRVKILVFGLMFLPEGLAPFRECFWAHVTSVTSFGMVTDITPDELR